MNDYRKKMVGIVKSWNWRFDVWKFKTAKPKHLESQKSKVWKRISISTAGLVKSRNWNRKVKRSKQPSKSILKVETQKCEAAARWRGWLKVETESLKVKSSKQPTRSKSQKCERASAWQGWSPPRCGSREQRSGRAWRRRTRRRNVR